MGVSGNLFEQEGGVRSRFSTPDSKMEGLLPIPEVRDKITFEIEDEEGSDAICKVSHDAPMIALKDKNLNRNYELLRYFEWIEQSHVCPVTGREITLETIRSFYEINFALMKKFDNKLIKYGYTRDELLKHYKISPELYAYLLALDFSKKERFKNIKEFINKYELQLIISLVIILGAGLYFLYQQMFLSQICLSSSQLDAKAYNFIYPELSKRMTGRMDNPYFNNKKGPLNCISYWPNIFRNMPVNYFNGSAIGYESNTTFFETTAGRIKDHYYDAAFSSFGYSCVTTLFCFLSYIDEPVTNPVKYMIMAGFILVGLAAITDSTEDLFKDFLSRPSQVNSYARACNDAFLRHTLINNVIPPELSPALELPVCSTPWLNLATVGYTLLAGPVSFFGARLFQQACRKARGLSKARDLSAEEQFDELRKRKFSPE